MRSKRRNPQPHFKDAPKKDRSAPEPKSEPKSESKRAPARRPRAERNNGKGYWIYSDHAALTALNNDARVILEAYVTAAKEEQFDALLRARNLRPKIVSNGEISKLCGSDAVHQGIALRVQPLDNPELETLAAAPGPILILDQVTDPRNIGAILRSAAAFDAAGVIVPSHHAPEENAVMARAAAGALDQVPLLQGGNLAQTIEKLKKLGRWCVGLDASSGYLHQSDFKNHKVALILGSEGSGMRRLTREACDEICALPISERMESLNVSVAAALALYELYPKV